MDALVKQSAAPGLWLEDVPEPTIGINDVLIRVDRTGICGTDVHIYNWDAWAQRTHSRADGRRPRVRRRDRRGRLERQRLSAPARSSAAKATSSAAAAATAWRAGGISAQDTKGIGVNRPGAFAEYIALPMTNVWHHDPRHRPRRRGHLRSVRQRRAHRAVVRRARRRRADHRRGPDRHHGRRGRAARRARVTSWSPT